MNKIMFACLAGFAAAFVGPAAPSAAIAAGCVNGVYRAGCAGPNGAVGVRKAPVYRPRPAVVTPARPPVVVAPPPRTVVVAPRPPVVVVPPPRPIVVVPPPG